MQLTVHRATAQIGGNCVEIATAGNGRILLDIGRPLDAPPEASGLLPTTLDLQEPVAGILISHPHQDHYGLLEEAPADWPVYSGRATARLMHLTASIFGTPPDRDYRYWKSEETLTVGPFQVTPFLTDHSAFDAYMLLIEAAGKRILYSGDFRAHGRKAALVERFIRKPPPDIDVLLMEGTNLGSSKPTKGETDLENDFVDLCRQTPGRLFVCWSAQNIDRTVTIYRACLKSGRTMAVDLYTAEVLELLAEHGRLPRAGWENLKVVITRRFARLYEAKGKEDFVKRMAAHGVSAARLVENAKKWVIMIRPSLIRDLTAKGVMPDPDDVWCYSQWSGYLKEPEGMELKAWFETGGSKAKHIHSSGHASIKDLKRLASAVNPRWIIPIHGANWDANSDGFPPIKRCYDGERLTI